MTDPKPDFKSRIDWDRLRRAAQASARLDEMLRGEGTFQAGIDARSWSEPFAVVRAAGILAPLVALQWLPLFWLARAFARPLHSLPDFLSFPLKLIVIFLGLGAFPLSIWAIEGLYLAFNQ